MTKMNIILIKNVENSLKILYSIIKVEKSSEYKYKIIIMLDKERNNGSDYL